MVEVLRRAARASAIAVLLLASAPAAPVAAGTDAFAATRAYQELVKSTAGIRTMSADIEVDTHLRSFPPISLTFHGHTYFQAPDKSAVVFDDVPNMLKKMMSDSPSIAPAPRWRAVYDVTVAGDDGTDTVFHLVPKAPGSKLDHIDAIVDDASGLVTEYDFADKDGATTTTHNSYTRVEGHEVPDAQTGSSQGHGYRADVVTRFSNYRLNAPLPPDAFSGEPSE
jgi:outer membrane lipoprotein-sorting protein